ncbi:MAG TPA: hypothetical protein VKZ63_14850 [Kofleriaceae bacterium]|nr:hypothetical protein [Kofleriaceae bacterium]
MPKLSPITAALALAAGLSVAGAPAAAQPEKPRARATARPKKPTGPTRPPTRSYEFDGDAIDGTRNRPDGTTLFGLKGARHPSLIQLRGHFLPEIARAAERID